MEGCPPPKPTRRAFLHQEPRGAGVPSQERCRRWGGSNEAKRGTCCPGGAVPILQLVGTSWRLKVGCWEPTEDAKPPGGTSWVKDVRGQVRDVMHPTPRAWRGHGPRLGCSMARDAPWPGMLHSLGSSVTRDVP